MDHFSYIDRTEPNSPTFLPSRTAFLDFPGHNPPSPTPQHASPHPSEGTASRSLSDLKTLGRKVYREVWDEFYDWEPSYCTGTLSPLKEWSHILPRDQVTRVAQAMVTRLLDDTLSEDPKEDPEMGTGAVTVDVTSYSQPGGGHRGQWHTSGLQHATTVQTVSIPVITIDEYLPHPVYESCPPISRSVLAENATEYILPFLPYADDPKFAAQVYQSKFQILEWETPYDPDVEVIQIEAIRRLFALHDVKAPSDIDRMKVFKGFRIGNHTGLLWEHFQRDQLHWLGSSRFEKIEEKALPTTHTPDPRDLRRRLISNLAVFCPNLNCLHAVCPTHGTNVDRTSGSILPPPELEKTLDKHVSTHVSTDIPSRKPRWTGQRMILSEGDPCGPDCFRHIQDFDRFMETLPPSPAKSHNLDTLETILGIAPDLFPCHLAIICLRPCKQIFVQRLQLFPDHTILTEDGDPLTDLDSERESRHVAKRNRKQKLRFVDEDSILSHELLDACSHPGECTSNICPCYVGKQHCKLTCRCGTKCVRQWKGCNCSTGKCAINKCDCMKNSRECIPGICISCDAGFSWEPMHEHQNAKPIEIKCGKHGLGAFACQDMDADAYIGTYTGYILRHDATELSMQLAEYIGLNYMFDMQPEEDACLPNFNAAYLGNGTRFLNHRTKDESNVEAFYKVVNGEHQIGFFTKHKVKAGDELFLDYGEFYWGK